MKIPIDIGHGTNTKGKGIGDFKEHWFNSVVGIIVKNKYFCFIFFYLFFIKILLFTYSLFIKLFLIVVRTSLLQVSLILARESSILAEPALREVKEKVARVPSPDTPASEPRIAQSIKIVPLALSAFV